jgi:hypothetical protein
MHNPTLPSRVEQQLTQSRWYGIGELHIFAADRRNPNFLRIVDIVTTHRLPLLMHSDPAFIDALFEHSADAKLIWAHAGAFPFPPLIRNYRERYPGLYVDPSVRDQRIAPFGVIDPDWEWLLMEHSDRFLIGVDT